MNAFWIMIMELASIVTVLGFNYAVFIWIANMNKVRRDVESIKSNHLPHMHRLLVLICTRLGIDYSDPEEKNGPDQTSNT